MVSCNCHLAVAPHSVIDNRDLTYVLWIQIGDILLIRTGFYEAYTKLTDTERIEIAKPTSGWIGLQASEDMADFLHDSYFSAVVADNPSVEAWPLPRKSPNIRVRLAAGTLSLVYGSCSLC